ncbi:MAG: Lrp/AsnC family transcriptional regulator [Candidatus Lokiarchaeia archaeon]|nr:Lrp/AsnC family transcriptional regulator [Candidatus Lokiarchaeia archaeon]
MIDDLNKNILREYQKDASITYRKLALKVGESPSTVFSRIKQMKKDKVIKDIVPLVDPDALDKPTTAWIKISLTIETDCCEFAEKVAKNENAMEVHEIAGEWDILIKVKVKDNLALHDLTKEISKMPGIKNMESLIAFCTVKEDPRLNL